MWIEPVARFSFQVVGGMCWLVALVTGVVVWRVPQGDKTAAAWWAILFFVGAGLSLILVARRLRKFSDLPQILDPETRNVPPS